MKNAFSFFILLTINFNISIAQPAFQSFLNNVNSLGSESEKLAAVDAFMLEAESFGFPYIHGDTANFIYRGAVSSASVAGDFNFWDSGADPMNLLAGTDFYYLSVLFEEEARLDYKFVLNNSSWILDPLNPNMISGGFGPNSELAMPGYIQPWEVNYQAGIAHGTIENLTISSSILGDDYLLRVYLPPSYDPEDPAIYPTVYFQDGFESISLGNADNVIDNLIDSNLIEPVIGVFVKPNNRNEEYAFSLRDEYRQFFVEELVPYIDGLYRTRQDPASRLVTGPSFGGHISALISYYHPDVFGLAGLHSCSLWPNDNETYDLITGEPEPEVSYYTIWGTYEGGLSVQNSLFQLILSQNEVSIESKSLPEGHSWGLWRATYDDFLIHFFPKQLTAIFNQNQEGTELRVFPNPASDRVLLELPESGKYQLILRDLNGRELYRAEAMMPVPGNQIEIPVSRLTPGTYIADLRVGENHYFAKVIRSH